MDIGEIHTTNVGLPLFVVACQKWVLWLLLSHCQKKKKKKFSGISKEAVTGERELPCLFSAPTVLTTARWLHTAVILWISNKIREMTDDSWTEIRVWPPLASVHVSTSALDAKMIWAKLHVPECTCARPSVGTQWKFCAATVKKWGRKKEWAFLARVEQDSTRVRVRDQLWVLVVGGKTNVRVSHVSLELIEWVFFVFFSSYLQWCHNCDAHLIQCQMEAAILRLNKVLI